MDIESINAEWAEDCKIDRNNLTEETLKTANLHSKYLQMLMNCKNKYLKYHNDVAVMRELRSRYYSGQLSVEELYQYGWKQYQGLKPLKSDLASKLDADSELLKLKLKMQYMENMIEQLEYILQSIKGRDWAVKNHIEYLKFAAGA